MTLSELDVYPGDTVDVLYNLDINEFQGTKSLQMIVKDIRLSKASLQREIIDHKIYDELVLGNTDVIDKYSVVMDHVVPTRDEFVSVYNVLKRELRVEHEVYSIRALEHLLRSLGHNISYVKLKFIISVFKELNLIGVTDLDPDREIYSFKYIYVKNKTSLDKSNILKKLRTLFKNGE